MHPLVLNQKLKQEDLYHVQEAQKDVFCEGNV